MAKIGMKIEKKNNIGAEVLGLAIASRTHLYIKKHDIRSVKPIDTAMTSREGSKTTATVPKINNNMVKTPNVVVSSTRYRSNSSLSGEISSGEFVLVG